MGGIVTFVNTVLDLSRAIEKIAPTKDTDQKNVSELRTFHWSKLVVGSGSIVGGITIVSSFVLKNYTYAPMGAVLLLTNAIAFYYLDQLDLLAPLNEVVKDMKDRVELLQGIKEKIESNIKQTKAVIVVAKKVNEDYEKNNEEELAIIKKAKEVYEKYQSIDTVQIPKISPETNEQQKEILKKSIDLLYKQADDYALLLEKLEEVKNTNTEIKHVAKDIEKSANKIEKATKKLKKFNSMKNRVKEMIQLIQKLEKYHSECVDKCVQEILLQKLEKYHSECIDKCVQEIVQEKNKK